MADTQWEELDGSAYLVRTKGERYTRIAEAIARSTKALDSIVDEIGTKSLAMDETRKLAATVSESIDKAQTRYREAGDALTTAALRPGHRPRSGVGRADVHRRAALHRHPRRARRRDPCGDPRR
jgi:hypothetical protein